MNQPSFVAVAGQDRLCGGLTWLPLVFDDRPRQRAELRTFLRTQGSVYGVLVPSASHRAYPMAGAVISTRGGRPRDMSGLVSAAQWFASSVDGAAVYVARLEHGLYWVLIAVDGAVDPRSDRMLRGRAVASLVADVAAEAAESRTPLTLYSPGPEFVPSEVAGAGYQALTLEQLLRQDRKPAARIAKHIGPPSWLIPSVVAIAVTWGLVVAGGRGYTEWQHRQLLIAEHAQLAREALSAVAAESAERGSGPSVESLPVAISPLPHAVIDACLAVVVDLPMTLGGWVIKSVDCLADGPLTAEYVLENSSRGAGTQQTFADAADAANLEYRVEWFGDAAEVAVGHLDLTRRTIDSIALPATAKAGAALSSHAARLGRWSSSSTFTVDPPGDVTEAPRGGYHSHAVTASGVGLWQLKAVIPDLPHLSIESVLISRDTRAWRWNASGTLYTTAESSQ